MSRFQTPGVYFERLQPAAPVGLRTGVPAILGFVRRRAGSGDSPREPWQRMTKWHGLARFQDKLDADVPEDGFLAYAVRGFFENGGHECYVLPLDEQGSPDQAEQEFNDGLQTLTTLESIDLVCAPDIMRSPQQPDTPPTRDDPRVRMQRGLLKHCEDVGDCMAVLDSVGGLASEAETATGINLVQQQRGLLNSDNAALYFPWVQVSRFPSPGDSDETQILIPPCGLVAGVYARTDGGVGVHKAPANEQLRGVVDLEFVLTAAQQGPLNEEGINALRVFPGRGIRVWGARTLSPDPIWKYVNVRRVFLTAARWIELNLAGVTFEPNNPALWTRITRDLTDYFNGLFQQGALQGQTAAEAFRVKCDEETNPPEGRDAGRVVTEIGLAAAKPAEFIVVRIIQTESGVTIVGPG